MPGFEPQTDVHVLVIPADGACAATPTITELCLLACPDGANWQLELKGVGATCSNTLPADSSAVTVDIEWVDDSASDAVADLKATFSLKGMTVLVYNEIWRGSQVLDPGDVVNAEFATDGAVTTPSKGLAFIVEYKVLKHS
jgi:hypothetical protein